MREPQEPLFLARETYRRRRLMDAARVLPVAAALLFGLPLVWAGASTSTGGLYIFAVWFVLILATFALSRRLNLRDRDDADTDAGDKGT